MDKMNWEEGVKAIPVDMNNIHTLTESGLGGLVEAMSGGQDTLLFDNAPPGVSHVSPTITVTIPSQRFAILGVVSDVPATVVPIADVPTSQHRLFFVISRIDVTDTRDVLQETLGVLNVVNKVVVVQVDVSSRVELTSSGNPAVAAPAPALGPTDIGYIEYCTVIWDGITLTTNYNTAAIWQFPGGTITVTPHGPTHLPGGGDPVPDAVLSASPLGSDAGLMPAGAFAVLRNTLQAVDISVLSPYLVRVTTGDNLSPATPKQTELRLRTTDAFIAEDISGDMYLSLNYQTGPYAGTGVQPARATHTHSPSQSPVSMVSYTKDVVAADLASFITVPVFTSISRIYQTQVFWAPPGVDLPLIECSWSKESSLTTGARAHIIAGDKIRIETGTHGFVTMSEEVKNYVVSVVGSVTWASTDASRTAKSGRLVVRLIGER